MELGLLCPICVAAAQLQPPTSTDASNEDRILSARVYSLVLFSLCNMYSLAPFGRFRDSSDAFKNRSQIVTGSGCGTQRQ